MLLLLGLQTSLRIGHLPPFGFLESEALNLAFPRRLITVALMVTLGGPILIVPWLFFLNYAGFKVAKWVAVYLLGFGALVVLGWANPFGLVTWFCD